MKKSLKGIKLEPNKITNALEKLGQMQFNSFNIEPIKKLLETWKTSLERRDGARVDNENYSYWENLDKVYKDQHLEKMGIGRAKLSRKQTPTTSKWGMRSFPFSRSNNDNNSSSFATGNNRLGKNIRKKITELQDSQLPQGWKEFKNEEGRSYYYNTATGKSQWQKPFSGGYQYNTPTPRTLRTVINKMKKNTRKKGKERKNILEKRKRKGIKQTKKFEGRRRKRRMTRRKYI